jgi:hypothetical protein
MTTLLDITGFVDHEHRLSVGEMLDDVAAQVVAHRGGVPLRPREQMLQPVQVRSPRCSAIVQQFFRSSPDSMPSISPAACRTGS